MGHDMMQGLPLLYQGTDYGIQLSQFIFREVKAGSGLAAHLHVLYMCFVSVVHMLFQSAVMFLWASIANIRWFGEKRAYFFLIPFTNRGTLTTGAAMAIIVAGITEPVINLTFSAVDAIIKWSAWSAFLFKNHMAFNLFSDGGTVLSKKATNRFEAHSFFQ